MEAVEVLGCTHIEGNIAVLCPADQTFEELCTELIISLYHEFLCKVRKLLTALNIYQDLVGVD